jgi:hypothetical protein
VELVQNCDQYPYSRDGEYVIRGTILNPHGYYYQINSIRSNNGARRQVYTFPSRLRITNQQIINPTDGRGFVHDVWLHGKRAELSMPEPQAGADDQEDSRIDDMILDCNSFVRKLFHHPSLFSHDRGIPDALDHQSSVGEYWNEHRPLRIVRDHIDIKAIFLETEALDQFAAQYIWRVVWDLPDNTEPPPRGTNPVRAGMISIAHPVSYADEWGDIPEVLRRELDFHPLPAVSSSSDQYPPPFYKVDQIDRVGAASTDSPMWD